MKFVSEDGKVFDSQAECEAWEAGAQARRQQAEEKLRAARCERFNNAIHDCVSGLLYYDRKEDEELTRDDVKEMIASGEISQDHCVEIFRAALARAGVR